MKRVLVIDDDFDIRTVVKVALEKFGGWQVAVADCGAKGLEAAKAEQFDVILLDVSMPDMDGFCVFEQLQANSITQSVPVILLTAKVLPGDRRRFAEMKVAGVITKPFNPVTICNQVSELLKGNT
ncbi:MAG: response regulator [Oscillatoriales cyanobacterium C42_A2020_001]|nr:response regulator [Leptolyngbyaceae cyanobacterium C42_A2020_001]